jgi:pyruvate,water dikinase
MITDVIRPMVRQRHTVARSRADELRVRRETERELSRLCPNPIRRTILKGLAAAMRGFVTAREDTRFCRTELYGITRRVMLRLGADLAAAGHLDRPEDVIDLTVQEVLGAFEGTAPGPGLRALAADRRINRELHASLPAPPARQVTTANTPLAEPRPVPVPEQLPGQDVLRGLASSPGVVRARAKVVTDSTIPPESCQDRILIARETDPGWLFLMLAAKGLVVERGTLLSHTAITGRLLGVPTVVAVPGATTGIPDGAWIELDGTSGTVRLLDVS